MKTSHLKITDWDETTTCPKFINETALQSEEVPKFWRRTDVLIPGKTIDINSKTINVSLLEEEPSIQFSEDDDEEYEQEVEEEPVLKEKYLNQDYCVTLGQILSDRECDDLISAASKIGYSTIDTEYPKGYRNSERALIKSEKLASLLWSRYVSVVTRSTTIF